MYMHHCLLFISISSRAIVLRPSAAAVCVMMTSVLTPGCKPVALMLTLTRRLSVGEVMMALPFTAPPCTTSIDDGAKMCHCGAWSSDTWKTAADGRPDDTENRCTGADVISQPR